MIVIKMFVSGQLEKNINHIKHISCSLNTLHLHEALSN